MYNNSIVIKKGNKMAFESRVLSVVESVTDVRAYFFQGTMFLETEDSKVAVKVFNALQKDLNCGVIFGLCGQSETSYDFV
jgi:hypothetical protein